MQKFVRLIAVISIVTASLSAVPLTSTASTIGTSYDVECTTGYFTVTNNVVVGGTNCAGSAVIPNNVTSIGADAFSNKTSLTSLTIGTSVTTIGAYAFYNTKLTSLIIPNNVITIGANAFDYITSLESILIGTGVTTIGERAFAGAGMDAVYGSGEPNGVSTLTIPDTVRTIGAYAFAAMHNLQSLTIGKGITSVGLDAFSDEFSLGSYTYCGNLNRSIFLAAGLANASETCPGTSPASWSGSGDVQCIYNGAGWEIPILEAPTSFFTIVNNVVVSSTNCAGQVVIPVGVTAIAAGAFADAFVVEQMLNQPERVIGITSLSIPSSVTAIGDYAFYQNSRVTDGLTTLTIGDHVNSIGAYAFANMWQLESLTIGERVTTIGSNAFVSAFKLKNLVIPNSVTRIDNAAFGWLISLQSLTIGDNVSTLGSDAFIMMTSNEEWVRIGPLAELIYIKPIRSYRYCGTLLSSSDLTGAGLAGLTKTCVSTLSASSSPSAPSSLTAVKTGKLSASVTLLNNASNAGSEITSYTITASPGGQSKTFIKSGAATITYEFQDLQPATTYSFRATATNANGTSVAKVSNSITTDSVVAASLTSLTFTDDGTGTGGKLVWVGKYIDAVLYTGLASAYPGPYNYGAFTSSWNGRIRNLTPNTSYTISIFVISSDGLGESKSLTFKTSSVLPALIGSASSTASRSDALAGQLPKLFAWIEENTFVPGEADILKKMLNKFDAISAPTRSISLKLPTSRVVAISATTSTPKICAVAPDLTVRSIATGTCTISYTAVGASRAPVTMVKDFVFKKQA